MVDLDRVTLIVEDKRRKELYTTHLYADYDNLRQVHCPVLTEELENRLQFVGNPDFISTDLEATGARG